MALVTKERSGKWLLPLPSLAWHPPPLHPYPGHWRAPLVTSRPLAWKAHDGTDGRQGPSAHWPMGGPSTQQALVPSQAVIFDRPRSRALRFQKTFSSPSGLQPHASTPIRPQALFYHHHHHRHRHYRISCTQYVSRTESSLVRLSLAIRPISTTAGICHTCTLVSHRRRPFLISPLHLHSSLFKKSHPLISKGKEGPDAKRKVIRGFQHCAFQPLAVLKTRLTETTANKPESHHRYYYLSRQNCWNFDPSPFPLPYLP